MRSLSGVQFSQAVIFVVTADGRMTNFSRKTWPSFPKTDRDVGFQISWPMASLILKEFLLALHKKLGQVFANSWPIVAFARCGVRAVHDPEQTDPVYAR
ncbi:hypothetical protein [Castellaniella sp. GW247-6E4]|uniref:hypothetical protein n=1 Tax=Castellaniella sp. GW247-6E4 TaxID=3140380 RepID=UPI0033151F65